MPPDANEALSGLMGRFKINVLPPEAFQLEGPRGQCVKSNPGVVISSSQSNLPQTQLAFTEAHMDTGGRRITMHVH